MLSSRVLLYMLETSQYPNHHQPFGHHHIVLCKLSHQTGIFIDVTGENSEACLLYSCSASRNLNGLNAVTCVMSVHFLVHSVFLFYEVKICTGTVSFLETKFMNELVHGEV